ncbi:hypothetical protein JZ751_008750 [Albula glossodonta]|uniref:Uncharacterized protein n=1 Tax=Albula glossodonta TaxID=121402 RepID=A0A8T2P1I7_9TELE|nr:hypothetical protein JZ751_008750 [Albula glossodonta]
MTVPVPMEPLRAPATAPMVAPRTKAIGPRWAHMRRQGTREEALVPYNLLTLSSTNRSELSGPLSPRDARDLEEDLVTALAVVTAGCMATPAPCGLSGADGSDLGQAFGPAFTSTLARGAICVLGREDGEGGLAEDLVLAFAWPFEAALAATAFVSVLDRDDATGDFGKDLVLAFLAAFAAGAFRCVFATVRGTGIMGTLRTVVIGVTTAVDEWQAVEAHLARNAPKRLLNGQVHLPLVVPHLTGTDETALAHVAGVGPLACVGETVRGQMVQAAEGAVAVGAGVRPLPVVGPAVELHFVLRLEALATVWTGMGALQAMPDLVGFELIGSAEGQRALVAGEGTDLRVGQQMALQVLGAAEALRAGGTGVGPVSLMCDAMNTQCS